MYIKGPYGSHLPPPPHKILGPTKFRSTLGKISWSCLLFRYPLYLFFLSPTSPI